MKEVTITTTGPELTLQKPQKIGSREQALAAFVVFAIDVKQKAFAMTPGGSSAAFADSLQRFRDFLQDYHPLLPLGSWKTDLPDCVNAIVAIVEQQAAGLPTQIALEQLRVAIERLLDAIDESLSFFAGSA